jgi:hypothetical protein
MSNATANTPPAPVNKLHITEFAMPTFDVPLKDDGSGESDMALYEQIITLERLNQLDAIDKLLVGREIERVPYIGPRQSILVGPGTQPGPDEFECHPDTYLALPQDAKEQFQIVSGWDLLRPKVKVAPCLQEAMGIIEQ